MNKGDSFGYEVLSSSLYKEYYLKLPLYIINDLEYRLEILEQDPFDLRLSTHKLSGYLRNYYSSYLINGYRLIFRFISDKQILLIAVGPHSIYFEVIDQLFGDS